MSELFRSYEQQFIKGLSNVNKKIQSISVQTNQKKQLAFMDIKADLSQSQRNYKLMETEMIGLSPQIKSNYSQKLRQYKKDYQDMRKKLHREQSEFSLDKSKQALINAQLDEQGTNYRQRLIQQGNQMSNTTYKLKQSVKVMYQNLEISQNVGNTLDDHTERLRGNKDKLGLINEDLKLGQRRIKNMFARIRKNKFILLAVFVGILLIGIIILAVKLI